MRINHLIIGIAVFCIAMTGMIHTVLAVFPKKPITIMVYVKPGGGIDRDSRKLAILLLK